MAEEILWEEEQISADLQELEDILDTYEGEARISYELSDGMDVADSFLELQIKLQNLMDVLAQTLRNDIGYFRDIMNEALELDRQISGDLAGGN